MTRFTTSRAWFLLAISLGLAAPGLAAAAGFDGSRTLLCVPTDAIQCEGAGDCDRFEVEDLNFPKFVEVDFKAKQLKGTREFGTTPEVTPIQNLQKLATGTIIQGVENGRGWSMLIDIETGDMSTAIAGDDVSFVMFGVCQPR